MRTDCGRISERVGGRLSREKSSANLDSGRQRVDDALVAQNGVAQRRHHDPDSPARVALEANDFVRTGKQTVRLCIGQHIQRWPDQIA